jgi:hypothetical protein
VNSCWCGHHVPDQAALIEHTGDVHGYGHHSFARALISYVTTVHRTDHGDISFTISGHNGEFVLDPAEASRIAEETLRLIRGQS